MRFGISWTPDNYGIYGDLVARTEAIGIDRIGVPDTQASVFRDAYVSLAHLFDRTSTVHAGPLVSNPVTRHPAVAASAIASAHELSGGRAFITLATGDTGVFNLGLKPAKLAELEDYIRAMRELFTTGKAEWQGATIGLKWVQMPVPIYIAAEGPRSLRTAGRIADGVVVGFGFRPENVEAALGYIAEGAAESGRTLDDLDVWFMSRVAVADSREEAIELARVTLAASSAHAFRFSLEGKGVPPELVDAVTELERRYDHHVHNIPGAENPNGLLVKELGLDDYLASRFGIVGTEEDCREQSARLQASGVTNIFSRPMAHDRLAFLDRWERVIAPFV